MIASLLPWILEKTGIANTAAEGHIPDTVRYSFYIGGVVLLGALAWTVLRSREYSPAELASFDDSTPPVADIVHPDEPPMLRTGTSLAALVLGLAGIACIRHFGLDKQLYVLSGGVAAYGLLRLASGFGPRGGRGRADGPRRPGDRGPPRGDDALRVDDERPPVGQASLRARGGGRGPFGASIEARRRSVRR